MAVTKKQRHSVGGGGGGKEVYLEAVFPNIIAAISEGICTIVHNKTKENPLHDLLFNIIIQYQSGKYD